MMVNIANDPTCISCLISIVINNVLQGLKFSNLGAASFVWPRSKKKKTAHDCCWRLSFEAVPYLMWWRDLIPVTGLKYPSKKWCQLYVGTMLSPPSVPTSCGTLTPVSVLVLHTSAMSWRVDTWESLNLCLNRPKHQSGANFVWPAIRKYRWICMCNLYMHLQAKYHIAYLFLFCPLQLSQWSWAISSPKP